MEKPVAAVTQDRPTDSQQEALSALLPFCTGKQQDTKTAVLSGYAGTGKTWLATRLVRAACEANLTVAVCAPTHKAVSVITDKIGTVGRGHLWTGTLHALLGLRLKERHDGTLELELERRSNGRYLEDYAIIFVDEASMVGPTLLSYIERFTRKSASRLLYVGDPGQLLPIETKDAPQSRLFSLPIASSSSISLPPVFEFAEHHYHLTEIVRQKATGRPHPIVQFAQEIRRFIEGEATGVFDETAVRRYLADHEGDLRGAVRIARAEEISAGVVRLRQRHPGKDIRAVAWRNRAVDARNRVIHRGLAHLYGQESPPDEGHWPPFWLGETLIARETLHAFRPEIGIHEREAAFWERALAPADKDKAAYGTGDSADEAANLIPNNTEMIVREIEPMPHPYLGMASWRVTAEMTQGEAFQFFVADDPALHQREARRVWSAYRGNAGRSANDFRRAWTVTRACAPVTHAYAMTAHKSQGSTFDYALIDLSDLKKMIPVSGADDYHRALYVAVTRAVERVWLCV